MALTLLTTLVCDLIGLETPRAHLCWPMTTSNSTKPRLQSQIVPAQNGNSSKETFYLRVFDWFFYVFEQDKKTGSIRFSFL